MTMAQGRKASLDFVSSQQFSRFSLLMVDLHSSALSLDLLSLCFIGVWQGGSNFMEHSCLTGFELSGVAFIAVSPGISPGIGPRVMEGGQNLRMKTCFNSSQVFIVPDDVLPSYRFIERIDVMDRNGCSISPGSKLPFRIDEGNKHLGGATPSNE
ncbi:hypothetical protein Tco_0374348 [Tanacetum coccineum]